MEKKNLTCIVCPVGCRLEASVEDAKVVSVSGNTCIRGKKYAENELVAPKRTLTSTVKVEGASERLVPVKTTEMPKENMKKAMELINAITLKAPIKRGDIIMDDFTASGVKLIACKNVK